MNLEPICKKHHDGMLRIAEKLKVKDENTGWFMDEAIKKMMPLDIQIQKGYSAVEENKVIGFITYLSEYGKPKIGWMGVDPEHHREGIGKTLLEKVEEDIKKMGGTEIYVETPKKEEGLGTDYESTYNFYESMGFELHKILEDEPCDMALLKKELD